METAASWAAYNGCESWSVALDPFDGLDGLPGDETGVERYASGCSGAVTELWTVNGGEHSPAINDTLRDRVIAFLVDAGNRVFQRRLRDRPHLRLERLRRRDLTPALSPASAARLVLAGRRSSIHRGPP